MPDEEELWKIPENASRDRRHVDMRKLYAFYNELISSGYQDSYETAQARSSLELLLARYERMKLLNENKLETPDLGPIVPCDQDAVNLHYFEMARIMAGGLSDRLKGYSVWNEKSGPEIIKIAEKVNFIE
jgi:hypothetical protein